MSVRTVVLGLAMSVALVVAAQAQTIASKVAYIGQPRNLQISGLMSRVVNGLLNLQVEIHNTDNDDQQGYYRIAWTDETGFAAWEDEPWKPVLVHGGQTLKVLVSAPTPRAKDFKIEFVDENNWASHMGPAPVH